MNEIHPKQPSWRPIVFGGLAAIGIAFLILCLVFREIGFRAALGYDVAMWSKAGTAVRVYKFDHGHYPASLDAPDFRPYISENVWAFLREGRLTYHPPAEDSPPSFIFIQMTTPRGGYSMQLDGTAIYPNSK